MVNTILALSAMAALTVIYGVLYGVMVSKGEKFQQQIQKELHSQEKIK